MKLIILALCSLAMFVVPAKAEMPMKKNMDSTRDLFITSADGKKHDIKIELALTFEQQRRGLMNRTQMDPDAGMLFVFGDESERTFWMKDTLIPLDMVFIRKDGTISHIHPKAKPNDLTPVPSEGPAMAVLELNGGAAATMGIKPGDTVHHIFFGNSLAE